MRNRSLLHGIVAALVLPLLSGCHTGIYSDLSDCPQGVDFTFHVQTPCQAQPTYPSDITEVHIFAFDDEGRLTRSVDATGITLTKDYVLRTDYYHIGTSDFVVWAGSDLSRIDFGSFTEGVTMRDEMIAAVKRQAESLTGPLPTLYVGTPVDGPLTQEDRSHLGTMYDRVAIHLTQITNRVNFTIKGLDASRTYAIAIEDDNSRYTIDGSFAKDDRFVYTPLTMGQKGSTLTASFDLLRLAKGRHASVIITDTTTGEVVWSRNLIEELILYSAAGEPPYSLECDHLFDIELQLSIHNDTFVAVSATINQWNVVFRDVNL